MNRSAARNVPPDPYAGLRDEIANGRLLPNERLIEEDLAERFRTNRTSVRAALVRLEADGLVVRERNRGARVRVIALAQAREIVDARTVLERLVVRRAAERATAGDLRELEGIVASMRAALEIEDNARYTELNGAFHATILRISQHATAARLLDQLHSQGVRSQYRAVFLAGRAAHSLAEHERIVAAIRRHDADASDRAMDEHLAHVAAAIDELAKLGLHA
jgi:DNA-binding GntR family transcriptional regulator